MRTEEYVLMEQSDNYWREIDENAPKEAKLLGGVVTSTMKTMVSRGELDVTDTAQTPETLDSMVEKGGASLVRVLNGGNFNISLNTQLAPTDDVHFRRAMAYALDYDTVNNDIYVGSIKPTGPIISGMASALSEDEESVQVRYRQSYGRTEAVTLLRSAYQRRDEGQPFLLYRGRRAAGKTGSSDAGRHEPAWSYCGDHG